MTIPLEVSDVARSFGETHALHSASFTVGTGELVALLGPNGAGKTTLIRSIAGRLRIDGGSIKVQGVTQIAGGCPEVSQQLGVIPQDIALYDTLTPIENLHLFGTLNSVPEPDLSQRIEDSLSWTGLAERRNDLVKTFSGGMKRRLNIACGVIHNPTVILLDEPTVGVDPQSRERIREMLSRLRADGTSILLTTHQLDEAQQVADRIVIIDHGRTIASGTFNELLDQSIGRDRRVVLTSEETLPPDLAEFDRIDDHTMAGRVTDIASDLSSIMQTAKERGITVTDVNIQSPDLQSVFLHFTGHELRE